MQGAHFILALPVVAGTTIKRLQRLCPVCYFLDWRLLLDSCLDSHHPEYLAAKVKLETGVVISMLLGDCDFLLLITKDVTCVYSLLPYRN